VLPGRSRLVDEGSSPIRRRLRLRLWRRRFPQASALRRDFGRRALSKSGEQEGNRENPPSKTRELKDQRRRGARIPNNILVFSPSVWRFAVTDVVGGTRLPQAARYQSARPRSRLGRLIPSVRLAGCYHPEVTDKSFRCDSANGSSARTASSATSVGGTVREGQGSLRPRLPDMARRNQDRHRRTPRALCDRVSRRALPGSNLSAANGATVVPLLQQRRHRLYDLSAER